MLIERDISNTAFRQATELPPGTMSKLSCPSVLLRVCDYLNCDVGYSCEAVHINRE